MASYLELLESLWMILQQFMKMVIFKATQKQPGLL